MTYSKRRTKKITELLVDVNYYLRANKIKDEGDPVFLVITHSLIRQHLYMGFNYYKDKTFTFEDGHTETHPVLAGSSTDFEYLQIY